MPAFNSRDFNSQNMYVPFEGTLCNRNTVEQFKECDKMGIINAAGANLYRSIVSGEALEKPSILNSFLILSFADLKKYDYYYWFAFVVPKNLFIEVADKSNISAVFTKDIRSTLYSEFKQLSAIQKTYFLVDSKLNKILTLKEVKGLSMDATKDFYFAFFNISVCPDLVGSQLRNFVALLTHVWPFLQDTTQKFLSIICSRDGSEINVDKSMVFHLKLPTVSENTLNTWVGWEKNERDRLGPKVAHMKSTLDPAVLAENSVDLNLKLMKWRVVPDINLEKIKFTKCLLLGSGTLGCCVARSLLAWGVRTITMVDNSTVSFSNPVRQSLFTYEDSVKMRPKAEAAADRLKEIFPGVKSKGVQLTIPMPGHTVSESTVEQTTKSVAVLTDLIKESDVVFLLMDSRESRWLPAMLGSFYNKVAAFVSNYFQIVINAALGFDSYLVMRHGAQAGNASSDASPKELKGFQFIEGRNLGCYFCNDVTAPGDSVKNRTLDQQCTVTRPGIAQIAGALAVELAVSLLQHSDGYVWFSALNELLPHIAE
ncbi:hypothetical protein D910_08973 [Dendroctonus ponderosae]|uniref:Ubiquitin-like modifier-activating enzyme ATG7 n=1 Tax=Dendroctonus ponderosae TaxID=77166 RepID=U4UNP5_DENPD|nr:hypothetical protein D910_08973 [Dendroctonus ponderosae]